ncbi:MAG TPA: protein kinase [Pyrinomonadaceae bacterium]|jgi:non-specific serine/threonine protein kinase/serine/threonine-protein kinase
MNPERYQQVKQLFAAAVECDAGARADYLARACGGDEELRAEVESLLAHDEPESEFIEKSAFEVTARLLADEEAQARREQRIGAYKVLDEIGRGGMGVVYLAVRADEQFHKQVAIKLIKRGMDTEAVVRRFRNERQILAALDHPNIARLLDGGTTDDGLPYLVMEYVAGTPVTEYCDQHRLPTNERLRLFRAICAAVQHAHQHLVVHRDLKPSNILITPDGTPKLLDFGIAKVLDPELPGLAPEHTRTELRVLTPEYASPEQVRGAPITTASDIYSLGVLLYELLTGHRPYRVEQRRRPDDLARAICDDEPERPSAAIADCGLRIADSNRPWSFITRFVPRNWFASPNPQSAIRNPRSIKGDLDNIVLTALRKDPARRYASVEQFAADVRRYLDGLPVSARKDTFAYRATKFVKRHKVGVAAAALVVLATIAGLAATIWQAKVARAERARAERRFNDVRKLANSNLFELHDAIANLPGSTPARELLVKRALEYLDSLAAEAQDDPALQRELISAYLKVGNVQGNPNNANLGDTAGALASYHKALAIAERLTAADPKDAQARRFVGVVNEKMSDVQAGVGDTASAVASQRQSLAIFKALAEAAPANADAQRALAISHVKLGDVLGNANFHNAGDAAGAVQSYRASAAILEALYAADAAHPKTRRLLGLIYERLGTMAESAGDVDGALVAYRRSLALREPLAADFPTDTDAVRDAAIAHEKIGNVMTARGELQAALESRRKSLAIFQGLVQADARNVQARLSLAISHLHLGDLLGNPAGGPNLGRRAEALQNYQAAHDILRAADADTSGNVRARETLATVRQRLTALGAHP